MSHRVRLAALIAVSKSRCVRIANGNSRLVISSNWKYATICRAVSRSACADWGHHIWYLAFEQEGSESYFPVLIWTSALWSPCGFDRSFALFNCRFLSTAWPLIIGQPLCHHSFYSLTMVVCIVFQSAFKGWWLATVLPSRFSRWYALAAWRNGAGGPGVSLLWLCNSLGWAVPCQTPRFSLQIVQLDRSKVVERKFPSLGIALALPGMHQPHL